MDTIADGVAVQSAPLSSVEMGAEWMGEGVNAVELGTGNWDWQWHALYYLGKSLSVCLRRDALEADWTTHHNRVKGGGDGSVGRVDFNVGTCTY